MSDPRWCFCFKCTRYDFEPSSHNLTLSIYLHGVHVTVLLGYPIQEKIKVCFAYVRTIPAAWTLFERAVNRLGVPITMHIGVPAKPIFRSKPDYFSSRSTADESKTQ